MSTFSLRGVTETGGSVTHPLNAFTDEPTLDEAKARCASLVALMPESTRWTVTTEAKPEPKGQADGGSSV